MIDEHTALLVGKAWCVTGISRSVRVCLINSRLMQLYYFKIRDSEVFGGCLFFQKAINIRVCSTQSVTEVLEYLQMRRSHQSVVELSVRAMASLIWELPRSSRITVRY